jgi:hypothetical protein
LRVRHNNLRGVQRMPISRSTKRSHWFAKLVSP